MRQDVILRSAFVEGQGTTGRAARETLVPEGEAGVGFGGRRWRIEYRHVVRGRECAAQLRTHAHGSLSIARSLSP